MRWINADAKVVVTIYDEEHEEHLRKKMTVEEMLDAYTDGCPTVLSSERRTGQWHGTVCSVCGESTPFYFDCKYCPSCGAKMEVEHENRMED